MRLFGAPPDVGDQAVHTGFVLGDEVGGFGRELFAMFEGNDVVDGADAGDEFGAGADGENRRRAGFDHNQ